MCLAALALEGATLTEEEIRNAWSSNPDGGGIAYFGDNGKVRAFRTLSLSKFLRAYDRICSESLSNAPMAIHFRLATHGTSTIENVHPFWMDTHTLVIHNGIFPIEATGSRSDTAIFVEDTLAKLGPLWFDDENLWNLVEGYCDASYPNKLVVLTDNPQAKFCAYIANESAGNWNTEKNIWFSNRSHERTNQRATTGNWVYTPNEDWGTVTLKENDEQWSVCDFCAEIGVAWLDESGTPVCHICGTCQPCGFDWEDCACQSQKPLHRMNDNQLAFHTA